MEKAKVKVAVKTIKDIVFKEWTAEECKSTSGYGRDVYVKMTRSTDNYYTFIDCRYMINYTFEKAIKLYIEDYYGQNLKDIQIEKQ